MAGDHKKSDKYARSTKGMDPADKVAETSRYLLLVFEAWLSLIYCLLVPSNHSYLLTSSCRQCHKKRVSHLNWQCLPPSPSYQEEPYFLKVFVQGPTQRCRLQQKLPLQE